MANEQGNDQRCGVDRNAEHETFAEEVPGVAIHRISREHRRVVSVEQIDGRAQDDERNQCGQERSRLEVADQCSIGRSNECSCGKCGEHGSASGQPEHVHEEQGSEISDRKDGADAQINPAADHAERHRERDEAELGIESH
jgi:hypothetical protein